jgi:hypothetical protein
LVEAADMGDPDAQYALGCHLRVQVRLLYSLYCEDSFKYIIAKLEDFESMILTILPCLLKAHINYPLLFANLFVVDLGLFYFSVVSK